MKLPLLLLLCFPVSFAMAQNLKDSKKDLVEALNNLVTTSKQNHITYDVPMSMDSAFHIVGDSLTITWKYLLDGSLARTRVTAPISKIKGTFYDLYLGFYFQEKDMVKVYEQSSACPDWRLKEQTHLLHIAVVDSDSKKHRKIKAAIEKAAENLIQGPK
jgi:hypothetical protein